MSSVRELLDDVDTLRKLLPALVVVGPFVFAQWAVEKPIRRMAPILTVELLVLAAVMHYAGVLSL